MAAFSWTGHHLLRQANIKFMEEITYMLIYDLTSLVSCKDSTRVLEWAQGTVGKLGNKITVTTSLSSIYYSAELRPISRG